jgi:uncharacterized protein YrrD
MRFGHDGADVNELSGDGVLALPVRLHGIELGRSADILLDRGTPRVVGFDVLCRDEVHRFLPLPIAAVENEALTIYSPLVLLEADELDFYRSRAVTLSSLKGRSVTRRRRDLGTLRDVLFTRSGELTGIVLSGGDRIAFDDTLAFAPRSRSAA